MRDRFHQPARSGLPANPAEFTQRCTD